MSQPPDQSTPKGDVTRLLVRIADGDKAAKDALVNLIYAELRRMSQAKLRNSGDRKHFRATELAHEVCLRLGLVGPGTPEFHNRRHFWSACGIAMRRILMDYARMRDAQKRGEQPLPLAEEPAVDGPDPAAMLAAEEMLQRLHEINEEAHDILQLHSFVGCTTAEIAEKLELAERTVQVKLKAALEWVEKELRR